MTSRNTYGSHGHGDTRPPYRQRQLTKLRVISDAEKLEKYTYTKCRNNHVFPKKDRGGLPTRMVNESIDILSNIMAANELDLRDPSERAQRLRLQRAALVKCKLLMHHIRVVHDNNQIDDKVFQYWVGMVNSVKNQAAKWHKNDKDRAASLT